MPMCLSFCHYTYLSIYLFTYLCFSYIYLPAHLFIYLFYLRCTRCCSVLAVFCVHRKRDKEKQRLSQQLLLISLFFLKLAFRFNAIIVFNNDR